MIPTKLDFPVFEANQVLTNAHLNSVRLYLDEQTRLSRVTLHGIGVVCGLEARAGNTRNAVTLTKGYGVTSEGYLAIIDDKDVTADRYRRYDVPNGDTYPLLTGNQSETDPLLELMAPGHENYGEGDAVTASVLNEKTVVLFVELLEENLKNCSPASCDDKGKKVTVNYRILLVGKTALTTLHTNITNQVTGIEGEGDWFPDRFARLNLPDIRLPRLAFDLSVDVDGQAIFLAYQAVLSKSLFDRIGLALDEAYLAYRPIITALPADTYLSEKLQTIYSDYTDSTDTASVVFSQYFYDLLDDLIQAYDEFRSKALSLCSLCNPPEELFPRHLELGELDSDNFAGYKANRHYFRPSPALADEKQLCREVQQLFRRIRLMLEAFERPPVQNAVKIVPSRLGNTALSDKAIPYYFRLPVTSPLLAAWNFRKNATGRVSENTGYNVGTKFHRETEAKSDPLFYDLENYNFFRIEGHIGLKWRTVLEELLKRIREYRLPFDVVALNAFPAASTSGNSNAVCVCDDLQVIYDAWKQELDCLLKADIKVISSVQIVDKKIAESSARAVSAKAAVAKTVASAAVPKSSAAKVSAKFIDFLPAMTAVEGSLGKILSEAVFTIPKDRGSDIKLTDRVRTVLVSDAEIGKLSYADYRIAIDKPVEVVGAMTDFREALPDLAGDLNFKTVSQAYRDYIAIAADYRDELIKYTPAAQNPVITAEQKDEIIKTLDKLTHDCLVERLDKLGAEIEQRKQKIEESMFFNNFIRKHPGMEHKAGVSKGGTFVLVFQELPADIAKDESGSFLTHKLNGKVKSAAAAKTVAVSKAAAVNAMTLTAGKQKMLLDTLNAQGITLPADLLSVLNPIDSGDKFRAAIAIPDQVVIADFFLPYRFTPSCPPIQFVLPPPRPIFVLKALCADAQGKAVVLFEFTRRTSPCEVEIDDKPYVLLENDQVVLSLGVHKMVVRDAEGGISLPQTIEIFPQFTANPEAPVCNETNNVFTIDIRVTGRPPFKIDDVEVEKTPDDTSGAYFITAGPYDSGASVTFTVSDSSICPPQSFTTHHKCNPLRPDLASTPFNTAITIDVLANDQGSGLKVTEANLALPELGKVEIIEAKSLVFTPAESVSNKSVLIHYSAQDEKGETSSTTATVFVGRKPCSLPSDGQTKRSAYRLWIQSGQGKFTNYQQTSNIAFTLNDKTYELPDAFNLLQIPADLLNVDFKLAVSIMVEKLNKAVNNALDAGYERLVFKYDPGKKDPFDIVWIEYFKDDTFSFGFDFNMEKNFSAFNMSVSYANKSFVDGKAFDGVMFFNKQTVNQQAVPAFDSQLRNRCDDTPFEKTCKGFELQPAFLAFGNHFQVRGDMPKFGIAAWVWDISDMNGNQYFAVGSEVTIDNPLGFINKVRLTAISEKGCMASAVDNLPPDI